MLNFTIYDTTTGRCIQMIQGELAEVQEVLSEGQAAAEVPLGFSNALSYIDAGVPVNFPPQPSQLHTFNWTTKQWEDPRTLDDRKATKREQINGWRLKANRTSFTYLGKEIAADELSYGDIMSNAQYVASNNSFPNDWPGGWKCLDNTYVPIADIPTWQNFFNAMVNQGTTNFAKSQQLKAALALCSTPEQIEEIVW